MSRVSRGVNVHSKHKKLLKLAKGYYGRRKSTIRNAKQVVNSSMVYRYCSNKLKKRYVKSKLIKYMGQKSNEYSLGHKLIMSGLHKLGLTYNLSSLYELSQSGILYDALINLFSFVV